MYSNVQYSSKVVGICSRLVRNCQGYGHKAVIFCLGFLRVAISHSLSILIAVERLLSGHENDNQNLTDDHHFLIILQCPNTIKIFKYLHNM